MNFALENFAFISRNQPTAKQVALATEMGIVLHAVGDADHKSFGNSFVHEAAARLGVTFDGVILANPIRYKDKSALCAEYVVGVFEFENAAPEGAAPQFAAKALHLFDWRD